MPFRTKKFKIIFYLKYLPWFTEFGWNYLALTKIVKIRISKKTLVSWTLFCSAFSPENRQFADLHSVV